jgi:hypothetical protein
MTVDKSPASGTSASASLLQVHAALLVAVVSYLAFWFGPAVFCVGALQLLAKLWGASAATTAKLGFWWWLALVLTIGWGPLSGLLFLLLCARIRRTWKSLSLVAAMPAGVKPHKGEAPELFDMVERSRQVRTLTRPAEIWIDLSAGMSNLIYQAPGSAKRRHALIIGLPALAVLSMEDFDVLAGFNLAMLQISQRLLKPGNSLLAFSTRFPPSNVANYFGITARLCNRALTLAVKYAAGIASPEDGRFTRAVQTLHNVNTEFQTYWTVHVAMVLQTHNIPPVSEGFRQHWRTRSGGASDLPAASSLLRGESAIESQLTRGLLVANPDMEAISWNQAAKVLLKFWADYAASHASELHGIKVPDLYNLDLHGFSHRVFQQPGRLYDPGQLLLMGQNLLATAFAVALSLRRWDFLYSGPGTPLAFSKDDNYVEPFALLASIFSRSIDGDAFGAICQDNQITELTLG